MNNDYISLSPSYLPVAAVGGGVDGGVVAGVGGVVDGWVGDGVGASVGGGVLVVGLGQSSWTLFSVRVIVLRVSYWEPSDLRTVNPQLKVIYWINKNNLKREFCQCIIWCFTLLTRSCKAQFQS